LNNVYNGEGKLTEVSGASYEGLWINGHPECMAVKLVITASGDTDSVCIAPGQSFTVAVECQSDDGQVMHGNKSLNMSLWDLDNNDVVDKRLIYISPKCEKNRCPFVAHVIYDILEYMTYMPWIQSRDQLHQIHVIEFWLAAFDWLTDVVI